MGLHQPHGSAEPQDGWAWTTGEDVTYLNWDPRGEPNDGGGGLPQNFGRIYQDGTWDDYWTTFNPLSMDSAIYELDTNRAITLTGSLGADRLLGGQQADQLSGGDGADMLAGRAGADLLRGGAGNDLIRGNGGQDTLDGGGDADIFVFHTVTNSNRKSPDTILDFQQGTDLIALSGIDADHTAPDNQAFRFLGSDPFTGHAGELRCAAISDGNTLLLADVNGDGRADLAVILIGSHILDETSFLL